jgi:hypothetical protein
LISGVRVTEVEVTVREVEIVDEGGAVILAREDEGEGSG